VSPVSQKAKACRAPRNQKSGPKAYGREEKGGCGESFLPSLKGILLFTLNNMTWFLFILPYTGHRLRTHSFSVIVSVPVFPRLLSGSAHSECVIEMSKSLSYRGQHTGGL
jgi:hypothetical protein